MGGFLDFKPHLAQLDYPNINFMDDDQIENIFSTQNRYFLFKWLMNHLNSLFKLSSSSWSKTDQIFLNKFLWQCGFISSYENLDFLQKCNSLDEKQEIATFQRIFDFAVKSSDGDEKKENKKSIAELEGFLNENINLFPSMGEIKLRSSEERQNRREFLKNEIKLLKQQLENCSHDDSSVDSFPLWDPTESTGKLDNFRSNILKLRQTSSNISSVKEPEVSIKDLEFKGELGSRLSDFSSKISDIAKYFKNIKEMNTLNSLELQDAKLLEQDEIFKLAQQLSDDSAKIIEVVKGNHK